ncbi:helix-turn-helix domain-containing protein [Alkalihalobacillus deserti]|uniref:helix-turn-helix domain-containing protein n=1 Tax=Alkalihalobacillus deserti TaxID=2879466 RepID=UPI001D138C39|nr:helix-turn-helix domain-containing protein [Alkalihalobacillus deserti]
MNTEKKLISLINSARVLTSTLDLDKVLHQLIKEVLNVIEGSNASVLFLYDQKLDKLYPKAAVGFDMKYLKDILLDPGEGMSGKTFLSGKGKIFLSRDDTTQGMKDIRPETRELYGKSLGDFQYPASSLCVPLITKDDCIGVLTVDIFDKNIEFDEQDLRLLETFAVQATIAIENAMLFSRNERTKKVHEELSKVSLTQGGLIEMTKALAELIDCKVAVYNEFYDVLESSSEAAGKAAEETVLQFGDLIDDAINQDTVTHKSIEFAKNTKDVYFFPIKTGQYTIGLLAIFLKENVDLDPLDRFAIEQASVIFALEMNRRERTNFHDLTYSGYVLDQLLHHQHNELSLQQLSKLNLFEDQKHHYITAQIEIKDTLLSLKQISEKKHQLLRLIYRELSNSHFKALVLDKNMEIVFMFVVPSHLAEEGIYEQIRKLFKAVQRRANRSINLSILIGIGRIVHTLDEVKLSYRDAKKCVDYLQTTQIEETVLSYQQLGIQRLFLKTEVDELKDFVADTLGEIFSYDEKHETELLPTLKVYLECNQNMVQSAKKLYVHTNTIKYRLRTIKQILDLDSLDGRKAFDLQLGLYIYEYLKVQ